MSGTVPAPTPPASEKEALRRVHYMEYKDTKVPKWSIDEDGQPDYLVNAAWTAEDIDLIHQVKPATKNVLFKVSKAPLQRPEYVRMMKKRESERLPKQLKLNPDRASAISSNSRNACREHSNSRP